MNQSYLFIVATTNLSANFASSSASLKLSSVFASIYCLTSKLPFTNLSKTSPIYSSAPATSGPLSRSEPYSFAPSPPSIDHLLKGVTSTNTKYLFKMDTKLFVKPAHIIK